VNKILAKRLEELKISLAEEESIQISSQSLKEITAKRIGIDPSVIEDIKIIKKSLDLRHKHQPYFIYCLDIYIGDTKKTNKKLSRLETITPAPLINITSNSGGSKRLLYPPLIIGAGPAGLFAALILAENGYSPILLERGRHLPQRQHDVSEFWQSGRFCDNSNVQFGEGGAGAFSDGKLTFRGKDPFAKLVISRLIDFGADPAIAYWHRPHIGSDRLIKVVGNISAHITACGGSMVFSTRLDDIRGNDNLQEVSIAAAKHKSLPAEALVLAVGNGARDTYQMLYRRGLAVENKPFAVGLRICHSQNLINDVAYGGIVSMALPATDYRLTYQDKSRGRGVYSFCVCPGGYIINASGERDSIVTNGMSYAARDSNYINSAIVASVNAADFGQEPLAAMEWQRRLEQQAFKLAGGNYFIPVSSAEEFLAGSGGGIINQDLLKVKSAGTTSLNLRELLPEAISESIAAALKQWEKSIPGFILQGVLAGVETRTSAPVRILRGVNGQSLNMSGIFPAGEGAGYAGGIVSSAVDGMRTAQALMEKYQPAEANAVKEYQALVAEAVT